MKRFTTLLLLLLLLNSCKDKKAEEKAHAEKNRQINKQVEELRSKVEELRSKYDVVVDWEKRIDLKTKSYDEVLYTIQIQDLFLKGKERCYLFFVAINDIKKVNGKYKLLAEEIYPVDFRRSIDILLRLDCDITKVEKILKQRPSYYDRYALLATINSIEKPDLWIRPNIEYDLLAEDNTFAETHPDDIYDYLDLEISGENYNMFIAKGKCEDLIFVGKADWIEKPSEYEQFLKVFDSNQP